nr:reverse transcriptase domain-containing protein [Tanacetum cinerariifolium]
DDTLDTPIEDPKELPGPWVLFTGGSSCINSSGAGLIITNPKVMKFAYALRTNGSKKPLGNVDSKLMANQVNGVYIAKEPDMIKNLEKVKNLAGTFKEFSIKQVPRGENKKADAISKIASTSFAHLSKQVLVEELQEKSIDEKEILAVVEEEGHTWMILIYEYLTEEILPKEKRKARVICRKAGRYAVLNGILYKKSFLEPWLRCVGLLQANYILREIHEGPYNMHARPRSVVAKVLRSGYYWSTMHSDARNLIKEYKRANRSLGEGIKARLGEKNKNWAEEIPHVLWAHRTMIKASNEETSFSLTYGTEAVIPVEIGMPTMRTVEVDMINNDEALKVNLDLLEEKREQAAIQKAKSKAKMEKYYNARVHSTSFRLRDLVYHMKQAG